MSISFCTTCMGRLHHVRQTLPENLAAVGYNADVEFVLLDYNSADGLEKWVRAEMMGPIATGRLVYWRERSARHFLAAHAKNLAAGLSNGNVICNLDADNFLGGDYAAFLRESMV